MFVDKVIREFKKVDKPENKMNIQRFFKEKLDDPYMLKSAVFKKVCKECYKEIKDEPPKNILDICNQLVETGDRYPRGAAMVWSGNLKGQYLKSHFKMFESWLTGVTNWGACDVLCCGPLGNIIAQYPELAPKTKKWIKSKNRWYRRAAAVSLINVVKSRQLLDEVFDAADRLLTDEDDMVQKGYGWMLKVASNEYPEEVFKYVMKNKVKMPRTALRYAIEKLPQAKRKEAMKK
ncbi:MAG: DNA alkylation repair protein [FCB group bacterium]|nr:DNA alkylation repair protein [FCB group bacterium]